MTQETETYVYALYWKNAAVAFHPEDDYLASVLTDGISELEAKRRLVLKVKGRFPPWNT